MKPLIVLLIFSFMMLGCASKEAAHPPMKPAQREGRILLLDNSGGYSHAGRQIELLQNGNLIETCYTDVIGSERKRKGQYILKGNVLLIRFGNRGDQRLVRVSYGGDTYWVYPNEVERIPLPNNSMLRQISLKEK